MAHEHSNLVFRFRSMYDYHEDRPAMVDLLQRCEITDRMSASMSTGSTAPSPGFHCTFTDYLRCMEQYPESYCVLLKDSLNDQLVCVAVGNLKRVHYGEYIMTAMFFRLLRVEPSRQRQHFAKNLLSRIVQVVKDLGADFTQGYTRATNVASLNLQYTSWGSQRKELSLLHIFILPTALDATTTSLYKLNQTETERLWTVDLADWIYRPVLSDLRRIMNMKEYIGTFTVGDYPSGRYSVTSLWQPINFFQSPTSGLNSIDEVEILLSSISNLAFNNGIPYLLCHIDRSSVFNPICQKRALAMATEIHSRHDISLRITGLDGKFDKSPVWLDPRDCSVIPYFHLLSEQIKSQL